MSDVRAPIEPQLDILEGFASIACRAVDALCSSIGDELSVFISCGAAGQYAPEVKPTGENGEPSANDWRDFYLERLRRWSELRDQLSDAETEEEISAAVETLAEKRAQMELDVVSALLFHWSFGNTSIQRVQNQTTGPGPYRARTALEGGRAPLKTLLELSPFFLIQQAGPQAAIDAADVVRAHLARQHSQRSG